ncbi:MAG: hypothetical protein CVV49_11580 [Spirochaetae bacterium HGW-Spirochaetae-5]|nr:MAG: hypothetical protein CVV49_11580 [Spirochaetae bacterium HGW-Spirochaetae-5]
MKLFDKIKSVFINRKNPELHYVVNVDDEGISCSHPKRNFERINWTDIDEIAIVTTNDGPFFPDVWFVFIGKDTGCSFPQGATNLTDELLFDNIIKRFKNFDYAIMIQAMSCAENNKFICWTKR